MPKKPDAYYRPDNLDEAMQYLAQPDTAPLAGGTELLAKEEGVSLAVVDLQNLGLDKIDVSEDRLKIGAMVRLDNLDKYLAKELGAASVTPLLRKAIIQAGPNTYRNAATLGGVCASRLVDSELLSLLLVLDAVLILRAPELSSISLEDYLAADTVAPGLITEIAFKLEDGQGASERVARTPKDYPIVSISAWAPASGSSRLAATGLGDGPVRLKAAETELQSGLDDASIAAAADAASAANAHPGDFRGSAEYRAKMASVLTQRVLRDL